MFNWRLGNINKVNSVNPFLESALLQKFIARKDSVENAECRSCRYYSLCRTGCPRDMDYNGVLKSNYYCEAFKGFLSYAKEGLDKIVLAERNAPFLGELVITDKKL